MTLRLAPDEPKPRILVVDDDPDTRELLAEGLAARGFSVSVSAGAGDVGPQLAEHLDGAVVDVVLDEGSGFELCQRIRQQHPGLPILIMTAHGDTEVAIEAMRAGAYDFISKPFELDTLVPALERAIEPGRLAQTVSGLHSAIAESPRTSGLLGESPAMKEINSMIGKIAQNDATVLIMGESGTGKDLIARAIHDLSPRSDKPFLALNCATHETLLESELFGHVKGAFTDARDSKPGMFVDASGGTLFLDEIGELPLDMQPKLLRVLQERLVRPVGADYELDFDTRIIAATNRDLGAEVAAGRFREDLYYRIDVVRLETPSLRERGDDILLLSQHFIERHAAQNHKDVRGLTPQAAERLLEYDWPGNVRELENTIARAVTLTQFTEITTSDLPDRIVARLADPVVTPGRSISELPTLREVTASYIQRVLEGVGGNKTRAAEILGLNRRTLYRKVKRLDIDLGGGGSRAATK